MQRQLSNGKQQPARKTSATKSPGTGILLNKSPANAKQAPPSNGNIETLNHFDKIQPKDDLEIKRQRDESTGGSSNGPSNKKDKKKGGKHGKKDASPATTVAVVEKKSNAPVDVVDATFAVPSEPAVAIAVPVVEESPRNTANKQKMNKKKRNAALLVQQLGKFFMKS